MASFEENLLSYSEAERIRVEHTFEGLSTHQLAFKHGLSYKAIQDILHFKIHARPAPEPTRADQG